MSYKTTNFVTYVKYPSGEEFTFTGQKEVRAMLTHDFQYNVKIDIQDIIAHGNTVTVEYLISSDLLKKTGMSSIAFSAIFTLVGNLITSIHSTPLLSNVPNIKKRTTLRIIASYFFLLLGFSILFSIGLFLIRLDKKRILQK